MKIIYAGTPDFSVPALQALLASEHEVCAVYTQPDRRAGRGRLPKMSAVKEVALEAGIEVCQPLNFKQSEDVEQLQAFEADLMVVVAYGLILPQVILVAPRLGCLNLHASLLPRWRGAAPIQRAILAGDAESGITLMQMDVGLDTGDMLAKSVCPIEADESGGSLHDKLCLMGADLLLSQLAEHPVGGWQAERQKADLVTYASKLDKTEATLDWQRSALQLERQVRAFNPWPVAQTLFKGKMMRVWQAEALRDVVTEGLPGTVMSADKSGIRVACGEGVLQLKQVQLPGKKALKVADFLNAHSPQGCRLGESESS
ncbi:MAG: methionyl-tRNA formyltransferase [Gammaproteobacteria bacterium]|nr:methionyl-tRNA formyltransferase [Gammaproteobacteria bacterium]